MIDEKNIGPVTQDRLENERFAISFDHAEQLIGVAGLVQLRAGFDHRRQRLNAQAARQVPVANHGGTGQQAHRKPAGAAKQSRGDGEIAPQMSEAEGVMGIQHHFHGLAQPTEFAGIALLFDTPSKQRRTDWFFTADKFV
ncbi:MAG TPA: hypothetical protein VMV25_04820 [Steroidobacteraceae bacterium]|nr:hypothetical protein [Steroidobacteraceae bacterium]